MGHFLNIGREKIKGKFFSFMYAKKYKEQPNSWEALIAGNSDLLLGAGFDC